MIKKDFFTLIVKKRFRNKSQFRMSILVLNDKTTNILIKWIWDQKFIKDYIAPLNNWNNLGFLLSPTTVFNTKDFTTTVDVIGLTAGLEIEFLFENIEPNKELSYEGKFLSTIILPHSYIQRYQLQKKQKIKFKKYKKTSNFWLENY